MVRKNSLILWEEGKNSLILSLGGEKEGWRERGINLLSYFGKKDFGMKRRGEKDREINTPLFPLI